MEIISKKYKWSKHLKYRDVRKNVDTIVLHHSASGLALTPDGIHQMHLNLGWAGIGYHFVITPDGKVHTGRPITADGANVAGHNSHVIGICFIGNFDTNKNGPTQAQIKSGQALTIDLFKIKKFAVKGHRDLMATACPGRFFPMNEFKNL